MFFHNVREASLYKLRLLIPAFMGLFVGCINIRYKSRSEGGEQNYLQSCKSPPLVSQAISLFFLMFGGIHGNASLSFLMAYEHCERQEMFSYFSSESGCGNLLEVIYYSSNP